VVTKILGLRLDLGLSALATNLSVIPGELSGLITDGVFHGASGVLTSVASHYPDLDFGRVRRSYAAEWSSNQICKLSWSLEPIAMAIAETVTTEWVKEARRVEREATLGEESTQAMEARSSTAPTTPGPDQGTSSAEPAMRPLPSTSSADADRQGAAVEIFVM
jgi:hypothetical protein